MTAIQHYFDTHARAFDRLYETRSPLALLRRGPRRGRDLAAAVVARHRSPSVLDLGCGPGRVAAAVLDAGAASYRGIDVSPRMLALARRRLAGRPGVELVEGDFRLLDVRGSFGVVLALGLFDYLDDAGGAAAWMRSRCRSTLVASFTRRDLVKAPLRHLRYQVLHRCPVFDYTEAEAAALLREAGFTGVDVALRGRRGFLVCATP